jgi:hypothetical protein
MLTLFRKSLPAEALADAFSVLESELTALPEPSLLEIERRKSDDLQIELNGQISALDAQIADLQERRRQTSKVLKAEILRARELNTDGGYDPEKDGEGCFAVAVAAKEARGDKHFRKTELAAAE